MSSAVRLHTETVGRASLPRYRIFATVMSDHEKVRPPVRLRAEATSVETARSTLGPEIVSRTVNVSRYDPSTQIESEKHHLGAPGSPVMSST